MICSMLMHYIWAKLQQMEALTILGLGRQLLSTQLARAGTIQRNSRFFHDHRSLSIFFDTYHHHLKVNNDALGVSMQYQEGKTNLVRPSLMKHFIDAERLTRGNSALQALTGAWRRGVVLFLLHHNSTQPPTLEPAARVQVGSLLLPIKRHLGSWQSMKSQTIAGKVYNLANLV